MLECIHKCRSQCTEHWQGAAGRRSENLPISRELMKMRLTTHRLYNIYFDIGRLSSIYSPVFAKQIQSHRNQDSECLPPGKCYPQCTLSSKTLVPILVEHAACGMICRCRLITSHAGTNARHILCHLAMLNANATHDIDPLPPLKSPTFILVTNCRTPSPHLR